MTTFRLLEQTSRYSRFAQVTVEVAASSRPGVEVLADASDEHRREAELGAQWALHGRSEAAKVTVTQVAVTECDTGVGDVYEATAHAVWQALRVEHQVPYVGFSDPSMVEAWLTSICGRRLEAVTEARHWFEGRREPDAESLLHAWLFFEHTGPIALHGRGDQFLLSKKDPYRSYDMDEYGQTRVGPALSPDVLSSFVGARLSDGAAILGHDGDAVCAGLVLRFGNDDLVVGALADEWVLSAGSVPTSAAQVWAVRPFVGGSLGTGRRPA
ncbi:hypothetical protein BJ973_005741 [Actinoplanes tereljensis]|uniref:Uncharacterized protein n=1 Tax=Paractinoplanes tereljensis TaxID=571912 RepID=A0A919NYQ1_9ACTN|nr:hypothetical protein [Actinoplanes tereljensis]GIF26381.1 hypothetical protein Ate02nite_91110 [Actinoplanes tereljensis]